MKRKLLLINALLFGVLILAGSELYRTYLEGRQRYDRLEAEAAAEALPEFPTPPMPEAVRPGDYLPVVSRLLFSKDRNADVEVVIAEPEPEQRPPLPFFSGLVDFGDGPLALMAPTVEDETKWIGLGEKIGEFVFQGLAEDGKVKLGWKEQEIIVAQSELKGEGPSQQPRQAARSRPARRPAAAAAAAPPPAAGANLTQQQQPASVGGEHNIGREIRPGVFAADPKDRAPAGTKYKGYVKEVRQTPFGSQSWWKKVE